MGRQGQAAGARVAVTLETGPDPVGFLPRYLAALTPLALLPLSAMAAGLLRDYLGSFLNSLTGPVLTFVPWTGDLVEVSVFLAAPVGIYLAFVLVGLVVRSTEMWAATALALALSALTGAVMVTIDPDPSIGQFLDLLSWITYLVVPVSLISVVLVLGFVEQYRRSIRYIITREHLVLRGGIGKKWENLLPWHQAGRLVMEQGVLGRLLNRGTIIPAGPQGPGAGSRAVIRELSRSPRDCLYGVKEPALLLEYLQELAAIARAGAGAPVSPPREGDAEAR